MFQHFLRTQTNTSSSNEGILATTTTTDIATTTTESSAIGRGRGDRASPPLVLSASLRQSFDASAFLCSAFAVLPTTTTTTTTTARADESQQGDQGQGQVVVGGGDLQSPPIHHHPSSTFPLRTPLWHQEAHCPHDRMLLRKLMLGRISECLRDDLSVSLTGTPYQLAIQPSMVPTQIPDLTNGGTQVIQPFNIVVSLSYHCHNT